MKKRTPLRKHVKEYGIDEQIEYMQQLGKTKNVKIKSRMAASIEQSLIAAKWLLYCQTRRMDKRRVAE